MPYYSQQTSERSLSAIMNAGKIDPAILNNERYQSLNWPEKLNALIREKLVDENQLVSLFARTVSLPRAFPEEDQINPDAVILLPISFTLEHGLLPYALEDNFLKVLIIDPRSTLLKAELKIHAKMDILFELTSLTHLEKLLSTNVVNHAQNKLRGTINDNTFDFSSKPIATANIDNIIAPPPAQILEEANIDEKAALDTVLAPTEVNAEEKAALDTVLNSATKNEEKKEEKKESKPVSAKKSATIKTLKEKWNLNDPDLVMEFCQQILIHAVQTKVSDIHIESFRDFAQVRMRKDGAMETQEIYSPYLFKYYMAVTTRFKILADCDISEKRVPQDGAITIKDNDGNEVDFRFNVMPTKNGERIVMRILAGDPALSLDKIGFEPEDYTKVIDAITAPQGMVLVTGPTGSGKTTTLYGALQYINRPDINILTAEDPVEYYLEGAGQVQANEKIGLSFSSILRAFLRQDPEVILVGEIRDQETIDIAIKAALTGHLLLSTLHTNDAIATITRILNMGVPNFMISSALSLVVAQRLARKNCPACSEIDTRATPEILAKIGFKGDDIHNVKPKKGIGCKVCEGKGIKGRQGIYEVLRITPALEEAILKNEQAPALLEAARKDGFRTMTEIGRDFVAKGVISIEEFQASLSSDT